MILTKSLIRHLAYVPWLLSAGLVLGWAGEAQAQTVKLSVDKTHVREDGGAVTIKVTAKTYNADGDHAALGVERVVQLRADAPFYLVDGPNRGDSQQNPVQGFGRRFTMTLPTIVIPKDQKEVSVESVFTPIPTNHENNDNVTTGDNPYKATDRIPNFDLPVYLTGDSGDAVKVDKDGSGTNVEAQRKNSIEIRMVDADRHTFRIELALNPTKVSKETEETAVTVTARLDGGPTVNETLSFLLRQTAPSEDENGNPKPEAGRDVDYDITLSTLTIPKNKSSGSTTICIAPKDAGTGFIGISSLAELIIKGTDINLDFDLRDEYAATVPTPLGQTDDDLTIPGTPGPTVSTQEFILYMDANGDGDTVDSVPILFQPEDFDPDGTTDDVATLPEDAPPGATIGDPDNDSYYAYYESRANNGRGWDLNGDGDTKDVLKVVKEKDLRHRLAIVTADFEITETAIAATKGLTATPAVIREAVVGQEEGSREVQVELKIELANALPDNARVRFFVRDEIDIINPDGTSGLTDAQAAFVKGAEKAVRGTQYTATVDDLVIPAGEKTGTTALNLTIFDNSGKNNARVFRVQAQVGTISKYAFIKIADDETASTSISLSANPNSLSESAGETDGTITATLDGKVLDADQIVVISIDPDSEADRDVDYLMSFSTLLTIPAGEVSGSAPFRIDPRQDDEGECNETITIVGTPTGDGLDGDEVTIKLEDCDGMMGQMFAEGTMIDDIIITVGVPISGVVLPEAEGGEGDITYSVSELPAGLSFDAETRTVSGTPSEVTDGAVIITYTATDSAGATSKLTFTIWVNPALIDCWFECWPFGAGKRVPMLAGLNADARMYLDTRTAMPSVDEDFVLDVRVTDLVSVKAYGLQMQYEADKLAFVEMLTEQPLGGSELATPQVLADEAGVLTVATHGDIVSNGEVALSLVFRTTTEIENTVVEITDSQTYDSEFGFNRLALPSPVQLQTRPEAFSLANNYPNPFNPATTIQYALPQAADVELTVYNVVGQPVRTLAAEHQNAGRYVVEWDATNDSGHSLSSGMYFYRLQADGEFHEVKKMLLLK